MSVGRPLPIDAALPRIRGALETGNLVLTAPPGSGKTTRIPPFLDGRVLVVEPRRLATRLAATRVAQERGQEVGDEIGWQVRFDRCCGPRTRVLYLTDGLLTRRLVTDPRLRDVNVVVVDEIHERHLQTDLALAWVRNLQRTTRPDLRLLAMSATLNAAPLARFLGDCEVIDAPGRVYPVEISYRCENPDRPLETRIAAAVREALRDDNGDVLVFLPGAAEIRRAADACADVGTRVVGLHASMPLAEQAAAIAPGRARKVILSTNVAESSITVEGVTVVIDTGLARVAHTSPWSGRTELRLEKISQAAAEQRAGRAGRVRPGRCIRLYDAHELLRRPAHGLAEIHRTDLSGTMLALHGAGLGAGLGVGRPQREGETLPASAPLPAGSLRQEGGALPAGAPLEWLEAPSPVAIDDANALLEQLGAWTREAGITPRGRAMLKLPVHPRLARLVLEAAERGAPAAGCRAAAILSESDVRADARALLGSPATQRTRTGDGVRGKRLGTVARSDVLARMDLLESGGRDLDPVAARAVRQLERALGDALEEGQRIGGQRLDPEQLENILLVALLDAFPDRVARRRPGAPRDELLLATGQIARLATDSVVFDAEWMVCVEAELRDGRGGLLVRLASEIEPAWLLDRFIDRIEERDERVWNEKSERVDRVSRLLYGRLALDETRGPAPRDARTTALLADAAQRAGMLRESEAVTVFLHRLAFLGRTFPDAGLPRPEELDLAWLARALCEGLVSLAELRARGDLADALEERLSGTHRSLLARAAPRFVELARRRRVPVHYEADRDPWIASRLQDFLGMREGPRVADGRVPLVLHLLAPNTRAVQVTTDLAGFWARTWPAVRRELGRRYPRHAWPEDPLGGA